jgi:hypothetical protein
MTKVVVESYPALIQYGEIINVKYIAEPNYRVHFIKTKVTEAMSDLFIIAVPYFNLFPRYLLGAGTG